MGLHPVTDAVCETVSAWSEGPQRLQSLRENWERTAGPSTALRSGPTAGRDRRDDKGESGALKERLLGAGGDLLFWGPETVSHYFACSREKKLFT